jgi:phage tail-like protein
MAIFPVNPARFDPYKNFKFRLKWDGKYVAAVSKVAFVKRQAELADPTPASPSREGLKSGAIFLERGLTRDLGFHDWASSGFMDCAGLGSEGSLVDLRRDFYLEVYNDADQPVMAYQIYGCWVSEYRALPDLDPGANAIAIEHLKLENEGWERDPSVTEPPEPDHVVDAGPHFGN